MTHILWDVQRTQCSDVVSPGTSVHVDNLPFVHFSARSSRTNTRMTSILTSCPSLTALRISSHLSCLARPRPKCRYFCAEHTSTHSTGRWRVFWSVECLYVSHLLKKRLLYCAHSKFWLCIIRTFLPVVLWAAALPGEQWPVVKLAPQAALKRKAEIVVAPGTASKKSTLAAKTIAQLFLGICRNVGRDHAADHHSALSCGETQNPEL